MQPTKLPWQASLATAFMAAPAMAQVPSPAATPVVVDKVRDIDPNMWLAGNVAAGMLVTAIAAFMLNMILIRAMNVEPSASSRASVVVFLLANYAWFIYQLRVINLPTTWWTVVSVATLIVLIIAIVFMYTMSAKR